MYSAADKRFALLILVRARRFADEHDFSVGIANAKNGLSARAGQMRTLCAGTNAFANGREKFRFVGRDKLQAREHRFGCARRAIVRLSDLFQRGNDEVESRLDHCGRSSEILGATAIYL